VKGRMLPKLDLPSLPILNCGRAQAAELSGLGLIIPRPGRDGKAKETQLFGAVGAELKSPARGNNQAVSRFDRYRGVQGRVGVRRTPPNLSLPLQDIPDLLHLSMPNRTRNLTCRQNDLHHAGCAGLMPLVNQETNLRPIGSRNIR